MKTLILLASFLLLFTQSSNLFAKSELVKNEMDVLKTGIQGLTIWDDGNKNIYAVVKKNDHQRALVFLEKENGELIKEKFIYRTSDGFIGMFSDKDSGGSLITIWAGGSAYHIVVFESSKDIRVSFKMGSKMLPELIYDKCDNHYLLITDIDSLTSIYKKDAQSFKFISKVDFDERFNAVTRICQGKGTIP